MVSLLQSTWRMEPSSWALLVVANLAVGAAAMMLCRFGWVRLRAWVEARKARDHRILNEQLLLNVSPNIALAMLASAVVVAGVIGFSIFESIWGLLGGAVLGYFVPELVLNHLAQKRRDKLDLQIVDGITTIAASVRAGLTLVQAFEVLVRNGANPIRQEFSQLLREYRLGMDLNQAMRNASNRIGLSNYRLMFTAIEMHRQRGGDAAESLDRIAESIREIQRLEGKLDALTAQGRMQARMMIMVVPVLFGILYWINPEGVVAFLQESTGKVLLFVAAVLVVAAFFWIRRILAVDI